MSTQSADRPLRLNSLVGLDKSTLKVDMDWQAGSWQAGSWQAAREGGSSQDSESDSDNYSDSDSYSYSDSVGNSASESLPIAPSMPASQPALAVADNFLSATGPS